MDKYKSFLAIIPARGGSKRLPKKNILELVGKPLIVYSIESALNSNYIDSVLVSSDSKEILDVAKKNGAEISIRPVELARDTTTTFDTIKYTIENLDKKYDYIILLQPTSPLRSTEHIDEAIKLLLDANADAVISICAVDHNPLWSNTLPLNNSMEGFINNDIKNKRSQELKNYFRLNGAIYICKTERLLDEKSFFISNNIFAYKMERKYSIDIDEQIDFDLAELYIKRENI
jgi:CMP-N,N'-diacetyllegionaminic acid synthase